jgi:hypothetical protein
VQECTRTLSVAHVAHTSNLLRVIQNESIICEVQKNRLQRERERERDRTQIRKDERRMKKTKKT